MASPDAAIARPHASAGFTFLEVIIAVLVVGLSFGVLLGAVSQNLKATGRAQRESHAAELAELRARQILNNLATGAWLRDGTDTGTFSPPDDHLSWEVGVETYQLPLPAHYERDGVPSQIFYVRKGRRSSSLESILKRVVVRVRNSDGQEDLIDPFVVFAVKAGEVADQLPEDADPDSEAPPSDDAEEGTS